MYSLTNEELDIVKQNTMFIDMCKAIPPAEEIVNLSKMDRAMLDDWGYVCEGIVRNTSNNDYVTRIFSPCPDPVPQPLHFRYLLHILIEKGYRITEAEANSPGYVEYTIRWDDNNTNKTTIQSVSELINWLEGARGAYLDFTLTEDNQVSISNPPDCSEFVCDVSSDVYLAAKDYARLAVGRYYDIDSAISRLEPYQ